MEFYNDSQKAKLSAIGAMPKGKKRSLAVKKFAAKTKRSPSAINQAIGRILAKDEETSMVKPKAERQVKVLKPKGNVLGEIVVSFTSMSVDMKNKQVIFKFD